METQQLSYRERLGLTKEEYEELERIWRKGGWHGGSFEDFVEDVQHIVGHYLIGKIWRMR